MELKLVPPPEPQARKRLLRWLNPVMASLLDQAILSIVPPGPARDNLLRSVQVNTRAPAKRKAPRCLDPEAAWFVTRQINRGARRPHVTQTLWQFLTLQAAGRGSGVIKQGPRELAQISRQDPSNIATALRDLVAINALIKRDGPDGPEYLVNANVLTEAGGLALTEDQADHGPLRELPLLPGRREYDA